MMATKAVAKSKPAATKQTTTNDSGAAALAIKLVAESIDDLASEVRPIYHIEALSDNIGELASAMYRLANVTAYSALAAHGDKEDRESALNNLLDIVKGNG
jgi:hypothetical protein